MLLGVQRRNLAESSVLGKPLYVPSRLPLSLKTNWPCSPRRASPALGQLPLLCCWPKPWPGGRKRGGKLRLAVASPVPTEP